MTDYIAHAGDWSPRYASPPASGPVLSRGRVRYGVEWLKPSTGGHGVILTYEQRAAMIQHAKNELPRECCGLLLGVGDRVLYVFAGRNVSEHPTEYLLDAEDQARGFRLMLRKGWDLVGIFHSHPNREAVMSKTDLSRINYPDVRYVVISLKGDPSIRAYRLPKGEVTEEMVVMCVDA